jgi:hypothetical protein
MVRGPGSSIIWLLVGLMALFLDLRVGPGLVGFGFLLSGNTANPTLPATRPGQAADPGLQVGVVGVNLLGVNGLFGAPSTFSVNSVIAPVRARNPATPCGCEVAGPRSGDDAAGIWPRIR